MSILLIANTALDWDDGFVASLTDAGHRVTRYDLRGVGEAAPADPVEPGYTLRDLMADAVTVLDTEASTVQTWRVSARGAGSPSSWRSTIPTVCGR